VRFVPFVRGRAVPGAVPKIDAERVTMHAVVVTVDVELEARVAEAVAARRPMIAELVRQHVDRVSWSSSTSSSTSRFTEGVPRPRNR
jgi:hypothetical protein